MAGATAYKTSSSPALADGGYSYHHSKGVAHSTASSAPGSRQGSAGRTASPSTEKDASRENLESVGSKSSAGSSRPRNNSLRKRDNDKSTNTTPKRAQRQRAARSSILDAFAPQKDRKTSNFKVGNIGLGGRIYLRPVMRPAPRQSNVPQSPTRSKPPAIPLSSHVHQDQPLMRIQRPASQAIEEEVEQEEQNIPGPSMKPAKGTRTDFTGRESVWTKLSTHDIRGAPSDIFKHQARPRRSMSESTAEHNQADRPAALAQTKAFKVVIDRPDSDLSFQRQKARNANGTALDIPIPHYRIGSPRFSSSGTPFLHSSVYTQSQSNLGTGPEGLQNGPLGPRQRSTFMPTTLAQSTANRRHSHAATSPRPASVASYESTTSSRFDPLAWRQPPSMVENEGISPRVYDALAAAPNAPSVIKYSTTGEVIAATPARLIVQITAETFLDYELLSDFFLTVRCYLSTRDLLALLLARFEWAVNRQDDNGRIIRVRSFAAIRHWILNYFAYDFVPDRKLRLTFCRKLNAIFKVVQSREMGASDIKLIADLKKCWNGRCVMYWDRAVDNALEADILPGGSSPHGKTDSEELGEYGLGSVTAASTDMYSVPASPSADYENGEDGESRTSGAGHTRTTSGTTNASVPMSPTSDLSAPVLSCSIPAMVTKKAIQSARQMVGPVPAGQRPQTGGTRMSNGSSEAVREAQSLERKNAILYSLQAPIYRSVLRGHLLPPASPYVTTAPTTPGLNLHPMRLPSQPVSEVERKKVVLSGSTSGPGMKNLFGNIKRALSSKTSSTESYSEIVIMDNTGMPNRHGQKLEALGKSANVPMEVFNRIGTPNTALGNIRAAMRVDVLAEQIAVEFQKVMQRQQAPGQLEYTPSQNNPTSAHLQAPAEIKKLPSGMTSSSQSIVIFDDTGVDNPASRDGSSGTDRTPRESVQIQSQPMPSYQKGVAKGNTSHLAPGFIPQRRGSSNAVEVSTQEVASAGTSNAGTPSRLSYAGPSHMRNASQASSLRRVASYQSALNKPAFDGSRLTNGTSTPDLEAKNGDQMSSAAVPARGLRRVPGGDLRANQNIADLELLPRPKSTGSIATFSSTRESELLSFGDRITKTFKRDRTDRPLISPGLTGSFDKALKDNQPSKVSFIRTHSEEKPNRRPSFEAVVASFADIPDEDEGGIEATLLKLEGRYRKGPAKDPVEKSATSSGAKLERTDSGGSNETVQPDVDGQGDAQDNTGLATKTREAVQTMASTNYARSEDSYNSIPLLERGADSMATLPKGKEVVSRIGKSNLSPSKSRDATKSFLLDEHDDDDSVSDGTFDTMDTRDTNTPDNGLMHGSHPPTPPISDDNIAKLNQANGQSQPGRHPPTPDRSPARHFAQPQFANFPAPTSQTHPAGPIPLTQGLQPRHMPFVLGHDSEVMFQQLTLIEKDALRELDWRDLVHMRWQQQAEKITNWVTYLSGRDPPGIDMVTSRFNIMVKWALSEIVLTESPEERALTIIKYIHIAKAARRSGNFATLLQLTIALGSADCSRLKGTWALVPQAEKIVLAELETLVSPHRNFANLRGEMEDAPAESGIIPVLALYIHDLTYNSQKPRFIDAAVPEGGQLVNFERYRSTAVIVKNLLRLIDASSRYNFVPVDDVLSHCMWMACLPDATILERSRAIESSEKAAMAA